MMNPFSDYGYTDSSQIVTIPEETCTKVKKWQKEVRDWENHIDKKINH